MPRDYLPKANAIYHLWRHWQKVWTWTNVLIGGVSTALGALVAANTKTPFLGNYWAIAAAILATGACCSGTQCAISAHHHASTKHEEAPMDCGRHMQHDSGAPASQLEACSMSCCNTTEQSAVHSNVFLLSPVVVLASTNPRSETISRPDPGEAAVFFVPLSPPPESLSNLI